MSIDIELLKYKKKLELAKDDYGIYLSTVVSDFEHNSFTKMLCNTLNEVIEYEKAVAEISERNLKSGMTSEESAKATNNELQERGLKPKRVMIFAPPQHGKSEAVTKHYPTYYLNHFPDNTVMVTAYSADTAKSFARLNYNDVLNYSDKIFNNKMDSMKKATRNFGMQGHRGTAIFDSLSGGLTGQPANLFIIDDPVKNATDVKSEVMRERLWDNWTGSVQSRLSPIASVIIIMTRWHADDLCGRILRINDDKKRLGEDHVDWEILSFPCECVDDTTDLLNRAIGEPLVPFRNGQPYRDKKWIERTKASQDEYMWQCLYQCNPLPTDDMQIFKSKFFNFYTKKPQFTRVISSWDFNFGGSKKTSDYIVGQIWGETEDNYYYLIHQIRGRYRLKEVIEKMMSLYNDYKPDKTLIEAKANGEAVIDLIDGSIPNIVEIKPTDSKEERAEVVAELFERGKVYLPRHANWIADYTRELQQFPTGANDDQVDTTTQALLYMKKTKPYKVEYIKDDIWSILQRKG